MSDQLLINVLKQAAESGASDVHITAGDRVFVRRCGRLESGEEFFSAETAEFFCHFDRIIGEKALRTWKEHHEIDLSFEIAAVPQWRFRLNGYWSMGKPAAAIRLVTRTIPEPEELGFPPLLKQLSLRRQGLILITGPSGSGKSTTLASLVQWLSRQEPLHIITLEDPVEYRFDSRSCLIHQRQIGDDAAGFPDGVIASLREDPDVLCVGELREHATIGAALTAAETGHLVLATLHASDAPRAIDRVVDAFPAQQRELARAQLALTLTAVCAQTLLPSGGARFAVFELLTASSAVVSAIREGKTALLKSMIQTGGRDGMVSFEASLARLVATGAVSAELASRYVSDPAELARLVRRERGAQ